MIIIGAGMTGCLAGLIFPEAIIYESQKELPQNHNAVLRFRDDSVSKVTGIPFREVTVRKGIVLEGDYVSPNIAIANMYSRKVLGHTLDRSIWNLSSSKRYVAPQDFQIQLAQKVKSRIALEAPIDYIPNNDTVISTMPLVNMLSNADIKTDAKFEFANIYTVRYKLPNTDVFQTVYFPGAETTIYRATVTGDDLILESTDVINTADMEYVVRVMGLTYPTQIINSDSQQYGKIRNIDEGERRRLLYQLTAEHNVYSAGRFAIWKNVLMDDVLKDLYVIKRMLDADVYNRHKNKGV